MRVVATVTAWVLVAGCATLWSACAPIVQEGDSDDALLASLQVYTSGERIGLVLQLTNTDDAPLEVTFPSGQSFDFLVQAGPEELWRWSGDQLFTQAVRRETWGAGESRRFEAEWEPPASARGMVTVTGMLVSSDHPVRQSTRITLP
jgi:hypothetical protein